MGKTLSYREEMLYYTGTYTNIHSYPNKLTNKRIEQQEALNISSMDKCEDERAKKQGSTQGHCPQGRVINTLIVQAKENFVVFTCGLRYQTTRLGCENTSARTSTPYLSVFPASFVSNNYNT